MNYFEDAEYSNIDFTIEAFEIAEYERCTFINCNLAGVDISKAEFTDCTFTGCNMSNIRPDNTAFRKVRFSTSKLIGVGFDECNDFLFAVSFDGCQLDFSSFHKLKLKKTNFTNCTLIETDFAEADLTGATFHECDISGATFDNTTLEAADFRNAYNYIIDPERNRIKKAKFSTMGLAGLLGGYGIIIE